MRRWPVRTEGHLSHRVAGRDAATHTESDSNHQALADAAADAHAVAAADAKPVAAAHLPPLPTLLPTRPPTKTPRPDPSPTPSPTLTPEPTPTHDPSDRPTDPQPPAATATPPPGSGSVTPSPSAEPDADALPPVTAGGSGPGNAAPGSQLRIGRDWEADGGTGPQIDVSLAAIESLGTLSWAVPSLVLAVPGLLLVLAVLAQAVGGVLWLPVIRRRIGSFGVGRRRA
jgi:hypothetical protein